MDSFGTEAQFNFNQYKEKVDGGSMGAFGRYNLNLRQFQTMFRKIVSVFSLTLYFVSITQLCYTYMCAQSTEFFLALYLLLM